MNEPGVATGEEALLTSVEGPRPRRVVLLMGVRSDNGGESEPVALSTT